MSIRRKKRALKMINIYFVAYTNIEALHALRSLCMPINQYVYVDNPEILRDLLPDAPIIFVDGWKARNDALEIATIVENNRARMRLDGAILGRNYNE